MTSRLYTVAIDATNPPALARWWAEALGMKVLDEDEDECVVAAAEGSYPYLDFLAVPDPKAVKNRLHFDIVPAENTPTAQAEEVERLISLGATRADVGQGDDVTWVVLADPEGNEFCVLTPRDL